MIIHIREDTTCSEELKPKFEVCKHNALFMSLGQGRI